MSWGDCTACDEPLRNGQGLCHACVDAREIERRDLRRVLRAARRLLEDPTSASALAELGVLVEMAAETERADPKP